MHKFPQQIWAESYVDVDHVSRLAGRRCKGKRNEAGGEGGKERNDGGRRGERNMKRRVWEWLKRGKIDEDEKE